LEGDHDLFRGGGTRKSRREGRPLSNAMLERKVIPRKGVRVVERLLPQKTARGGGEKEERGEVC